VLQALSLHVIVNQMHDLFPVGSEKVTAHGEETGWNPIMDALAGRTAYFLRLFGQLVEPLPTAAGKDRAANLTQGGFVQFTIVAVGVGMRLLKQSVPARG
jgi:hypothetical protein